MTTQSPQGERASVLGATDPMPSRPAAPCPCWRNTYSLGHGGHCCFVHGDRRVNGGFREDADICHAPNPP